MKKVLSIALVSAMALTGVLASTNTAQAAVTNGNKVTVEKGDSYKSIAEANGISISALEQANGREVGGFDLIFPGETITLPGATNTTANTTTNTSADTQAATTAASTDTTTDNTQTQQTTDTTSQATTQSTSTTGTSQGTFKISFYDPAVLGSNMGYSGVAANLSVFPKGTQLKITLSDGTVLYRTVNDTGTFANSNSQQLDVAMPSSSIPSYGVTTASVEVLS
ncbi:LysM peptidoglycan-binding domain-containing protein [Companilactobacillus zhachilii]|uniref:LysM peptidoglycan-binding domain-containing protein n=1 Tax=Companilactobacillus zhachilii TaxID=2304606 RepID=A0A386PSF0_9LACO|nr:LysM peptidoglycan-binding domain-containing protein [Companilactobacillus zhachilii]AYE37805.1 LysM peptidoglycan-binding domain-containing protein [Companilactobacillus zhachilii]MBL3530553.1 LysM peptidoglycan-binding domain-containing protein [Companilactobacillus zhachilii]